MVDRRGGGQSGTRLKQVRGVQSAELKVTLSLRSSSTNPAIAGTTLEGAALKGRDHEVFCRSILKCGLSINRDKEMVLKRESRAEEKTFVSIMRKMSPGEVSDDFLLTQLAVVRTRMGTQSPHWPSSFHCNMMTP